MTTIDWLMILGYFGVLAGVVAWSLRKNKIESGEDLFLGGRNVGWLAIGASIFAAKIDAPIASQPTDLPPRNRSSSDSILLRLMLHQTTPPRTPK